MADNSGGGNTMLALIVGGLVVIVILVFVFGGGFGFGSKSVDVNVKTPNVTAPAAPAAPK